MKSDERLMLEYQEGSIEAFQKLYERHKGKVYAYVKSKSFGALKDYENDIFQTVFEKLHDKKELYNYDSPFLPWLFTIARNTAIDAARKEKLRQHAALEETSAFDDDSFSKLEAKSDLEELGLDSQSYKLLYLKYVEGLDYKEMEEELGAPSSAIRKRVSRVLNRLKKK